MTLKFENAPLIHAPLGLYSHTVTVPERTELVFISGQVGVRPDGSAPSTIEEQADQVFANIGSILDSHDLCYTDIVRLGTFIVFGHDGDAVRSARQKYLGSHRPASTAIYVAGLVSPSWYVEVDAIAARTRSHG